MGHVDDTSHFVWMCDLHLPPLEELQGGKDIHVGGDDAAWERGTNENTNGLLRQYFPRKSDFQTISNGRMEHAMSRLNFRPRKILRFRTPFEVLYHTSVVLTT